MSDRKLKWKYSKLAKYWWTLSASVGSLDGFTIRKSGDHYMMKQDDHTTFYFKKLSSAKKVAELIRFG